MLCVLTVDRAIFFGFVLDILDEGCDVIGLYLSLLKAVFLSLLLSFELSFWCFGIVRGNGQSRCGSLIADPSLIRLIRRCSPRVVLPFGVRWVLA